MNQSNDISEEGGNMVSIRIGEFFDDPKGPVGMLIGGVMVAIATFGMISPYWNLPDKVQSNTGAIKKNQSKLADHEDRLNDVEEYQDQAADDRKIIICNAPFIGESWKQKKNCEELSK